MAPCATTQYKQWLAALVVVTIISRSPLVRPLSSRSIRIEEDEDKLSVDGSWVPFDAKGADHIDAASYQLTTKSLLQKFENGGVGDVLIGDIEDTIVDETVANSVRDVLRGRTVEGEQASIRAKTVKEIWSACRGGVEKRYPIGCECYAPSAIAAMSTEALKHLRDNEERFFCFSCSGVPVFRTDKDLLSDQNKWTVRLTAFTLVFLLLFFSVKMTKKGLKAITSEAVVSAKLSSFYHIYIKKFIFMELAAMIALGAIYVLRDYFFVFIYLGILVWFSLIRPTYNYVADKLKLSASERKQLESQIDF